MKEYTYTIFFPKNWFDLDNNFTCILHVNSNFNPSLFIANKPEKKRIKTDLFCNKSSGYINEQITKPINARIVHPRKKTDPFYFETVLDKNTLAKILYPNHFKRSDEVTANKIFKKIRNKRWNIFRKILKTA